MTDTLTLEFTPANTIARLFIKKPIGTIKLYQDSLEIDQYSEEVEFYEFNDDEDPNKVSDHYKDVLNYKIFIKQEDVRVIYMEHVNFKARYTDELERVGHYILKITFTDLNEHYDIYVKNKEECEDLFNNLNEWLINDGQI